SPTAAASWSRTTRLGARSSAFTCVPTVTVVTRKRRLFLRWSSVSSHHHVSHAERRQCGRKNQFMSHSQWRRELVDEDHHAQDHRPPQTGHPEQDHGHHERRATSKAAEAVARPCDSRAPHQVEGKRPVQRTEFAAAGLARSFYPGGG